MVLSAAGAGHPLRQMLLASASWPVPEAPGLLCQWVFWKPLRPGFLPVHLVSDFAIKGPAKFRLLPA
jgi:hypothetical protein